MGGIKGASPFYREENRDPREAASRSEEASQRPRPKKLTTTRPEIRSGEWLPVNPSSLSLLEWPAHLAPSSLWGYVAVALQCSLTTS